MFMSKFIWKEIELCAGNSEKTNVRTFNIIELLFVQYRFGLAFDFKPCLFLKTFHNFGHDDAVCQKKQKLALHHKRFVNIGP